MCGRMLQQVRSNMRLIEKFGPKKEVPPKKKETAPAGATNRKG